MRFGEIHERQYVVLGFVEHRSKFREFVAELIGDDAPLSVRGFGAFLSEDGIDKREYHLPLSLAGVRECIAHKMHPAALPRRAKHLGDCRLDALMRVADHQLDPAQPAARELAQELRPERLRLGRADIEAQNLAADIAVDTDGNDGGDRDDPIVLANL